MSPERLVHHARMFVHLRALPNPSGEERLLRVVLARIIIDAAPRDGSPTSATPLPQQILHFVVAGTG